MHNVLRSRSTYCGKTKKEGGHVVLINTHTNGKPKAHTMLVILEKVTGGNVLNIITKKTTSKIFEVSELKDATIELLKELGVGDYRDLNITFNNDLTTLDKDYLVIESDFSAEYKKAGIKGLKFDDVKKLIDSAFKLDYEPVQVIVSNDLPKTNFIGIIPGLYTSEEDVQNITENKLLVAGTEMNPLVSITHQAFTLGIYHTAFFRGETGTGKSWAARQMAADLDIPIYSFNFSAGTDEAIVRGEFVPVEDKEASFRLALSKLIKVIKYGGIFVLEELGFMHPSISGIFNSLLDFNGEVVLVNGEIVKMHPNCRIIATTNPNYANTNPINKALMSRFQTVVDFLELTPNEVYDMINRLHGYGNRDFAIALAEFVNKFNKTLESQGIDAFISLREMENCIMGGVMPQVSIKSLIKETIVNKALAEQTRAVINNMESVLEPEILGISRLYDQSINEDAEFIDLNISNVDASEIDTWYKDFGAVGTAPDEEA